MLHSWSFPIFPQQNSWKTADAAIRTAKAKEVWREQTISSRANPSKLPYMCIIVWLDPHKNGSQFHDRCIFSPGRHIRHWLWPKWPILSWLGNCSSAAHAPHASECLKRWEHYGSCSWLVEPPICTYTVPTETRECHIIWPYRFHIHINIRAYRHIEFQILLALSCSYNFFLPHFHQQKPSCFGIPHLGYRRNVAPGSAKLRPPRGRWSWYKRSHSLGAHGPETLHIFVSWLLQQKESWCIERKKSSWEVYRPQTRWRRVDNGFMNWMIKTLSCKML